MNWDDAIKDFRIQKRYQNASLLGETLLPEGIVNFGIKWLKSKEKGPLYLHGIPGCGKTHFMTAIFRHMVDHTDFEMIYIKSDQMDRELLQASTGKLMNSVGYSVSEHQLIEKYAQIPILFIDDLGAEKDSERVKQQYLSILDERYGNELITVSTSNLDLEKLGKTLGERLASRLKTSYIVQFPDQDLRCKVELPKL